MEEKIGKLVEFGYSPEYKRIEVVVPYGMKLSEFASFGEVFFTDIIGRLPRGCPNCHSGDNFFIRERMEKVIFWNIESNEIVRELT